MAWSAAGGHYGELSRVPTKKIVFVSMVYSFSLYDPLGQIFICLLTHFYTFSHFACSNSTLHLNLLYAVNFADVA